MVLPQVKESIPSLGELGGNQLYPADPTVGKYIPELFAVIIILLMYCRQAPRSSVDSQITSFFIFVTLEITSSTTPERSIY